VTGSVPILMYHQISAEPDPRFHEYTVTPDAFRVQLRWLRRAGYRSISMEELSSARAGEPALPRRPVVITFDDGFAEAIDHAKPALEEHGFRGTFFIVAGLVGQPGEWLRTEIGTAYPLADWPALRTLLASGHECGAHTLSHPRLSLLPPERQAEELRGSRSLLEDKLDREVRHLAYPFGAHDSATIQAAADAGYRTACTTINARCSNRDAELALPRIHVSGHDSVLDFAARVSFATTPGEWLHTHVASLPRRLRRRLRYPGGRQ
jgi:peptidoglycan/xylan/chitin deacetylase (PgdA/CDA1 family)